MPRLAGPSANDGVAEDANEDSSGVSGALGTYPISLERKFTRLREEHLGTRHLTPFGDSCIIATPAGRERSQPETENSVLEAWRQRIPHRTSQITWVNVTTTADTSRRGFQQATLGNTRNTPHRASWALTC